MSNEKKKKTKSPIVEWDEHLTAEQIDFIRDSDEEDDADYIDPWYIQPMDLIK